MNIERSSSPQQEMYSNSEALQRAMNRFEEARIESWGVFPIADITSGIDSPDDTLVLRRIARSIKRIQVEMQHVTQDPSLPEREKGYHLTQLENELDIIKLDRARIRNFGQENRPGVLQDIRRRAVSKFYPEEVASIQQEEQVQVQQQEKEQEQNPEQDQQLPAILYEHPNVTLGELGDNPDILNQIHLSNERNRARARRRRNIFEKKRE